MTLSPVHSCQLFLCHLCTCVHFRRALESRAKWCLHICHHIGLHRLAQPTLVAEQCFCSFSLIHDHWLASIVQQLDAVVFFGQRHEEQRRYICNRVINFCLFVVPWFPLLFLQFCTRAILQEITPKREQDVFMYIVEMQQVSMSGNFAPDFISL